MAETSKLLLSGLAIPSFSLNYEEIAYMGGIPRIPFLKQPAGTTAVVTIPLIDGALVGIQHLYSLQKADAVCFTSMGRDDIDWASQPRSTKVREVKQNGAKALLKLQLL